MKSLAQPVTLTVRNLSAVVQDLTSPFRVFLDQANNDLHLEWPHVPFVERIVELRKDDRWPEPAEGMWRATIYDYPYQAQSDDDLAYTPVSALSSVGYHFVDAGFPHLVVFAAVGQSVGIPWTMTFSHELLESLADPSTDTLMPCIGGPKSDGSITQDDYEFEICDPVQAQAYQLDDPESGQTIWVSNFVTQEWFGPVIPPLDALNRRKRYDFAGQLMSARQLALGGERTLKLAGRDRTEVLTRFGTRVSAGE